MNDIQCLNYFFKHWKTIEEINGKELNDPTEIICTVKNLNNLSIRDLFRFMLNKCKIGYVEEYDN